MNLWNLAQSGHSIRSRTSYILQEILPAFGRIIIIEPSDKYSVPTQSNNEIVILYKTNISII